MRCVAGVGLLLLVGCNQIFGITPTYRWDAAPDVIADMPHVSLTWQLATTLSSGAPAPALALPPFASDVAPQIRIATLDGPLEPAGYSSDPSAPGWILIPRSYLEPDATGHPPTWRLEYTLPGGVPHEVQWAPEDKLGHLTVPMVGRTDRQPAPVGGGYKVTPSNYSGSYTFPRVFTTGLWTEGPVTAPFTGPTLSTVDYDFFNAASLSGPKGRPDPAQGDRAFLVDFATSGGCRVAAGSAAFDPTLVSGVHTVQTPSWDAQKKPVMAPAIDLTFLDRVTKDPRRGAFNSSASRVLFGTVSSIDFPGLTGTSQSLLLPVPVMQTLLDCPYTAFPLPDTAQPGLLDDFPHVLHVQLVVARQALGVGLASGLETVIAASAGAAFKISFPAPMATAITLTTPAGMTIPLDGNADQVAIGSPSSGGFTLAFVPETGTDLRADYHDVILHRFNGSSLTTERIYTVTAPSVRIDGSLIAPGADYVFEIRSYKGHAMAARGDFVPVDYPYGGAVVYTRTFKTS